MIMHSVTVVNWDCDYVISHINQSTWLNLGKQFQSTHWSILLGLWLQIERACPYPSILALFLQNVLRADFYLNWQFLSEHMLWFKICVQVWNRNLQYASMHCTFFQPTTQSNLSFPHRFKDLQQLFYISRASMPSHSRLCPIFFYYHLITP